MRFFKNMTSVILAVIIIFGLTACGHQHVYVEGLCECGERDINYASSGLQYELLEDGTYKVVNYGGSDSKVYVPANHEGKQVTVIGEYAFQGINSLKAVNLPDTIITIEQYAFNACSALKGIVIPRGVKNIGNYAFADCHDVVSVKFNAVNCNDLETPNYAFRSIGSNTNDVKLIVSKEVTRIPDNFFYGVTGAAAPKVTSIEFEDNSQCRELGDLAFMHTRTLKTVDFGENSILERIGDSCFGACVSLQSVTIPASVRVIEKYAFNTTAATPATIIVEDPTGWCMRRFNLNTWEERYYKEVTEEYMSNPQIALQGDYARCYFSKIEDPRPSPDSFHIHEYDEFGVCYCLTPEEDHTHNFGEKGVCPCLATNSEHKHVYNQNGVCVCRAVNSKHTHSYIGSVCECGILKDPLN